MTGSELAAALRTLATLVESQKRVAGLKVEPAPGVVVSVRSSGAVRQARHREREALRGDAPSDVPRNDTSPPKRHGPRNESVTPPVTSGITSAVTKPVPSVPPLHSPSDPDPTIPKEIAVVSEGSDRSSTRATTAATPPRNHAEALTEPPAFVAGLCRDAMTADLLQAHKLPWVLDVLTAWHEARGQQGEPKVGIPSRDGGVRAVLELFAMGYGKNDLVRVARHLPTSDKFRDKVHPSVMTPDVVAIALAELNEKRGAQPSSFARDMVRRVESASRAPSTLAASLPRLAGGGGE